MINHVLIVSLLLFFFLIIRFPTASEAILKTIDKKDVIPVR